MAVIEFNFVSNYPRIVFTFYLLFITFILGYKSSHFIKIVRTGFEKTKILVYGSFPYTF